MWKPPSDRALVWEDCRNVRDLGGLPLEHGGTIRDHALVRADNPCRLTPAGRAALAAYGIRTVIDLRSETELQIDPSPFLAEPSYRHVPFIPDGHPMHVELNRASTPEAGYLAMAMAGRERVAAVLMAIAESPRGGVLVHCHSGKDRTGVLIGILLAFLGVPIEAIAEDYVESNERLRQTQREYLDSIGADEAERERLNRAFFFGAGPLLAVLEAIRLDEGGIRAFLLRSGATEETLGALRQRFVDFDRKIS